MLFGSKNEAKSGVKGILSIQRFNVEFVKISIINRLLTDTDIDRYNVVALNLRRQLLRKSILPYSCYICVVIYLFI